MPENPSTNYWENSVLASCFTILGKKRQMFEALKSVEFCKKQTENIKDLTFARAGGGGDATPMSFSGMAAKPLGGSR